MSSSDAGLASSDAGPAVHNYGPARIDTLFVVDNSGSMFAKQERLAAALPRYLQTLDAAKVDSRMGVVTTDLDTPSGERSGLVLATFSSAAPFVLTNNNTSACMDSGRAHACVQAAISDASAPYDMRLSALRTAVGQGTCGSGTEKGIDAIAAALAKRTAGACNEGFFRDDARLVVIILSDEEDSAATPVADALAQLRTLVPDASRLRVGAIIGGAAEAGAFVAKNCSASAGTACGGACAQRPASGSHSACTAGGAECGAGEYCDVQAGMCENNDLQFWMYCYWCSFYNAPDCCDSLGGSRYVDLVRSVEAANVAANPQVRTSTCPNALTPGCRLGSICDQDLGDTLESFARNLAMGP